MKGVILAAGKGTRMRELTKDQPKPMLETGKHKIIEHVFLSLRNAGIKDLCVVVGYYANIIQEYFKSGSDIGLNIAYVKQETLDGTAKAVGLTKDFVGQDDFLLTYADVIMSLENYPRMIEYFRTNKCDGLLSLKWVDNPWRGAAVFIDNDKVLKIVEKPPKDAPGSNWMNAGIQIYTPKIFEYIPRIVKSARGEYELPDGVNMMINDGYVVRDYQIQGFWGDIGTPEDIEKFSQTLSEIKYE